MKVNLTNIDLDNVSDDTIIRLAESLGYVYDKADARLKAEYEFLGEKIKYKLSHPECGYD